jgi:hypothetical protein
VSAPMTTRGDAATMVMSLLLVLASRWRHPVGRADNTLMRNCQAPD